MQVKGFLDSLFSFCARVFSFLANANLHVCISVFGARGRKREGSNLVENSQAPLLSPFLAAKKEERNICPGEGNGTRQGFLARNLEISLPTRNSVYFPYNNFNISFSGHNAVKFSLSLCNACSLHWHFSSSYYKVCTTILFFQIGICSAF